ncbi:MAG: glutamyl-tRNA reductase [Bacteroidetes bacterium]|nr:glutamyl-tRNA reductase [Bacteroidota bacterium]
MNTHIIAITHRNFSPGEIGAFHLGDDRRVQVLNELKIVLGIQELLYLSTCNRVEFIFISEQEVNEKFVRKFFTAFPVKTVSLTTRAISSAEIYSGDEALRHIFSVASSIDSMVVGEREIITQVRNAFEEAKDSGISGDSIRLLIGKTIETAKKVYTDTAIARNPVSVVSLAYRKMRELKVNLDSRFILIGSGVTNTAMARYLKKHGYSKFVIFNRTLENAAKLAEEISAESFSLNDIFNYKKGFDVIVTCTASNDVVITREIYHALNNGETAKKLVIDLAVPNDLDPRITEDYQVNLIAVNNLQQVAKENLEERGKEMENCRGIIEESILEFHREMRQRQVEIAMAAVPQKVKEIRDTAVNSVFAKEIAQLDEESKKILEQVLNYVEKKYVSVPMKMAREILIEETENK